MNSAKTNRVTRSVGFGFATLLVLAACSSGAAPPTVGSTSEALTAEEQVRAACKGVYEHEGPCVACVAHASQDGELVSTFAQGECRDGCIHTTCEVEGATCGAIPDGCGGTLTCGVPSSTFVPLISSAAVTGTIGRPTCPYGYPCCAPIASDAAAGVLAFDIESATCTLTYTGSGGWPVLRSRIPLLRFDGDTYTCGWSPRPGTSDEAGLRAACPDFPPLMHMGLMGAVTLTVRRTTGAVTLDRWCEHQPMECWPNWADFTTQLDVTGTTDCR